MAKNPAFNFYSEFEEPSEFGPSCNSGVYGVFITSPKNTRCVYIGSSSNIFSRVMKPSHPYRMVFDRFSGFNLWVYIRQISCQNYLDVEKELIKKYKPLLNKIRYGS